MVALEIIGLNMLGRRTLWAINFLIFGAFLFSSPISSNAQDIMGYVTPMEESEALPREKKGTRITIGYSPTKREKVFCDKLPSQEKKTGGMFRDYSILGKVGSYVGWFGIVRKIDENQTEGKTRLLVEMKYFDGLTDSDLMIVSFYGAGDFEAILSGVGLGIKPLSLVKLYGLVDKENNSVPEVKADYIRQWNWGLFAFMPYGKQKENREWQKLNKINPNRIYDPDPTPKYYEDRLGPREK